MRISSHWEQENWSILLGKINPLQIIEIECSFLIILPAKCAFFKFLATFWLELGIFAECIIVKVPLRIDRHYESFKNKSSYYIQYYTKLDVLTLQKQKHQLSPRLLRFSVDYSLYQKIRLVWEEFFLVKYSLTGESWNWVAVFGRMIEKEYCLVAALQATIWRYKCGGQQASSIRCARHNYIVWSTVRNNIKFK